MGRPIHFEIQADDLERAKDFYAAAFNWEFVDYSEYTGSPYYGVVTGADDEPGINGGLLPRPAAAPATDAEGRCAQGTNAWVVTMGTDDFDATAERILAAGGTVALPKAALPGMAWQGYFLDTENNTIGLHQPDPDAA